MINRLKLLADRGDTIIEVMIVLAVLGLAMSTSYVTANRGLKAARTAQENSEATMLLQAQIESLRILAPNDNSDPAKYIYKPVPFCIDLSSPGFRVTASTIDAACRSGTVYPVDISITYQKTGAAPGIHTFTAMASWDDAQGNGKDVVTLVYREPQLP